MLYSVRDLEDLVHSPYFQKCMLSAWTVSPAAQPLSSRTIDVGSLLAGLKLGSNTLSLTSKLNSKGK